MFSKRRKVLVLMGVGILCIGIATAIWVIGFYDSGIVGLTIGSTPTIMFTEAFTTTIGDATLDDFVDVQEMQVSNANGGVYLLVNWSTSFIDADIDDGCDPTNDVTIIVETADASIGNFAVVGNGNQFMAVNGETDVRVTTTAQKQSCPADWSTQLSFVPN